MVSFVAIDVETANSNQSSICQIGIADCRPDAPRPSFSVLVDPGSEFLRRNIDIHGITPEMCAGKPRFSEAFGTIRPLLEGRPIVAHSRFDANAIAKALAQAALPPLDGIWLDTSIIARSIWTGLENVRLPTVAAHLGYAYTAHDARHDAVVAGLILVRAMRETGAELPAMVERFGYRMGEGAPERARPVNGRVYHQARGREASGSGKLDGQIIVFTGEAALDREEMAERAARHGASVRSGVTGKTTMVVLGEVESGPITGKLRDAQARIAEGQSISIMTETEFLRITNSRG